MQRGEFRVVVEGEQCAWCPRSATTTVRYGMGRVRVCKPCLAKRLATISEPKPEPKPKPPPPELEPPEPVSPCTTCKILDRLADMLRSKGAHVGLRHIAPGPACMKCENTGCVLVGTQEDPSWQECPWCAVKSAVADSPLTAKEQLVVVKVIGVACVKVTAKQLGIASATVRNHLRNVYKKLGIHSQPELFQWVYRRILHRRMTRVPEI